MSRISDPRVFFAAERTLLAWIRTGLTIMAFGFVVARFGLFLAFMTAQQPNPVNNIAFSQSSNILGLLMILIGALCIFVSSSQHRNFLNQIDAIDLPANYKTHAALYLSFVISILGCLVAASLFFTLH